ncbi:MAG: hypothetical protein ACI9VR_000542 [Cognaticolwellia sp.]|jgi:hypothetical protein
MLFLLIACGPGLPADVSADELYGRWLAPGTEIGRSITFSEYEGSGWDHGYQRIEAPQDADPETVEQGSFVLTGFELALNPETDGRSPSTAQVLGFDGEILVLGEGGLSVSYERQ